VSRTFKKYLYPEQEKLPLHPPKKIFNHFLKLVDLNDRKIIFGVNKIKKKFDRRKNFIALD